MVKEGDPVSAEQAVARAYLPGEMLVLRLPEKLGIEAFEAINGLKVQKGRQVEKGELICEHAGLFGLFKSRFVAPASGTIEFISSQTGHVGLRLPARPIEVAAYMGGKIIAVREGKSVTVEARAAFIQGIFGVGGERHGFLRLLDVRNDQVLGRDDIPDDVGGAVLLGGTRPSIDAIRKAAEGGAKGLIVGSVDDRALKSYLGYDLGVALTGDEDIPMTLIVTEGFGMIPLAERIVSLCSGLQGQPVSINGATQVRAGAMRPEIIIASDVETGDAALPAHEEGLHPGSRIRVIRVPYFGSLGTVVELPQQAVKIGTGAFARVLRAELDDGRTVTVPRANVEIID